MFTVENAQENYIKAKIGHSGIATVLEDSIKFEIQHL